MRPLFGLLLLALTVAWSAEDPWQKAKELATGSDIRIYKQGSTKPIFGENGRRRRGQSASDRQE
jgi:hypothetical protein